MKYKKYIFVDTDRYFCKRIFSEKEIRVKAFGEMVKDGLPNKLVLCKVLKKDEKGFTNALEQIQMKALFGWLSWLYGCVRDATLVRKKITGSKLITLKVTKIWFCILQVVVDEKHL